MGAGFAYLAFSGWCEAPLPKYKYHKASWPALTSVWIRRRLRYESLPKEFQFRTAEIHK